MLLVITIPFQSMIAFQNNSKELHDAVYKNNYKKIVLLIKNGNSVNSQNRKKMTPLMQAVLSPQYNKNTLIYLLNKGAYINAQDVYGRAPLHFAAIQNNFSAVRILLYNGAKINLRDNMGATAFHLAYQNKKFSMAHFLKKRGGRIIFKGYSKGDQSVVCATVKRNNVYAFEILPYKILKDIRCRTKNGKPVSVVHLAVSEKKYQMLEPLMKRNLNWSFIDIYGQTPLHYAVIQGDINLVKKLIIAGADPNKSDYMGNTSLFYASAMSPLICNYLLKHGASVKKINQEYLSPIHVAIKNGYIYNMKEMMNRGALEFLETSGYYKRSSLSLAHYAANYGQVKATSILIKGNDDVKIIKHASTIETYVKEYKNEVASMASVPRKNSWLAYKRGYVKYHIQELSPYHYERIYSDYYKYIKFKVRKYPVNVFIPYNYSKRKSFGLVLFLHSGKSAIPSNSYRKILRKKRLLWVGFDVMKKKVSAGNELLALAATYEMQRIFNIDYERIYIAGFSHGGKIASSMVLNYPHIYKGAVLMGGAAISHLSPKFFYVRRNTPIVFATSDWDYNFSEVFGVYTNLLLNGFKHIHFLQENHKGHSLLYSNNFYKALNILDKDI